MISSPIMETAISLVATLQRCASLWATAQTASYAKLGRAVVNDGGFFARIDAPNASVTTATLEKFADYLGDEGNWPSGCIPTDVAGFVARVKGISVDHVCVDAAPQHAPSTGQSAETSGAGHLRGVA